MSEKTQKQEPSLQNQKFIEIEAPERLNPGQNLYDQEPFQSIIKDICKSSGATLDVVRSNISGLARAHSNLITEDPKAQTTDLLKSADPLLPKDRIPKGYRTDLIKALQPYLYWSEYIELQRESFQFDNNGNILLNRQPKSQIAAPLSYANWVTQKLQREKNSWLVGIDKVFPQDVGHPVTSQPNVTGINPASRRYRILKAAEIIR